MTAAPQTRFMIAWSHDGARQLEVVVDADLPAYGPLQTRVQGVAAVASSHRGLRLLLQNALGEQWLVNVLETVGGVTTVRLMPLLAGPRS